MVPPCCFQGSVAGAATRTLGALAGAPASVPGALGPEVSPSDEQSFSPTGSAASSDARCPASRPAEASNTPATTAVTFRDRDLDLGRALAMPPLRRPRGC